MSVKNQTPQQNSVLFNPFSAEFARNPYAVYRHLRENQPVYYHQPWDMWLFSRYDDVQALATDKRLFRTLDHLLSKQEVAENRVAENWQDTPNLSRYVRVNILDSEGEMHDRLRRLVFKAFTPVRINALRGDIEKLVSERIEAIKTRTEIDFIADFVAPIPGAIIGRLIGVRPADCHRLGIWSDNIVQIYEQERSAEDLLLAEQAAAEFARYLGDLAAKRRTNPKDDIMSELVTAEDLGKLSKDELIATCMILLMAGHGSTIDVSGNGMLALLQHPKQMQELKSEPSLIQTAVQEMFRYDAPLPFFHRLVGEDMEFLGQHFAKGTKIGLMYGAANHDPGQFTDPDRFDIRRSPNRHIAFGRGAHFCLGNHLARLDMEIMFTALLEEFPKIELATASPNFKRGITARGLVSLPILLN